MRLFDSITEDIRRSVERRLAGPRGQAQRTRSGAPSEDLRHAAFMALGLPSALLYLDAAPELGVVRSADRPALTRVELKALERAVALLPAFPPNVLNGCQSRAHVTFLQLAAAAPGKLHKVWLIGEHLLSPVNRSSIDYGLPNGRTSHWNYHVAVAYTGPDGACHVVDTLLSPRALRLEAWARKFVYRGNAVAMFTAGRSYSFYVSPRTPTRTIDDVSHDVLSGFYPYAGVTKKSRDGAKAIAADALSLAFEEGRCGHCSWASDRADAISLIAAVAPYLSVPTWQEALACERSCHSLREHSPGAVCPPLIVPVRDQPPDECREAFELFQRHVVAWAATGL